MRVYYYHSSSSCLPMVPYIINPNLARHHRAHSRELYLQRHGVEIGETIRETDRDISHGVIWPEDTVI